MSIFDDAEEELAAEERAKKKANVFEQAEKEIESDKSGFQKFVEYGARLNKGAARRLMGPLAVDGDLEKTQKAFGEVGGDASSLLDSIPDFLKHAAKHPLDTASTMVVEGAKGAGRFLQDGPNPEKPISSTLDGLGLLPGLGTGAKAVGLVSKIGAPGLANASKGFAVQALKNQLRADDGLVKRSKESLGAAETATKNANAVESLAKKRHKAAKTERRVRPEVQEPLGKSWYQQLEADNLLLKADALPKGSPGRAAMESMAKKLEVNSGLNKARGRETLMSGPAHAAVKAMKDIKNEAQLAAAKALKGNAENIGQKAAALADARAAKASTVRKLDELVPAGTSEPMITKALGAADKGMGTARLGGVIASSAMANPVAAAASWAGPTIARAAIRSPKVMQVTADSLGWLAQRSSLISGKLLDGAPQNILADSTRLLNRHHELMQSDKDYRREIEAAMVGEDEAARSLSR